MISYAQNFEDVILDRVFREKSVGFYLDIGACYPEQASVTKHFYDKGWSGVNVEPMEEPYSLLLLERPRDINVRAAIAGYTGEITIFPGPTLGESSALLGEKDKTGITVPCYTLDALCDLYVKNDIDFLKIDVEGLEKDIVVNAKWREYRPKVIVIEATYSWSTKRRPEVQEVISFLKTKNYTEGYFDGLNIFFLAKEVTELKDRLSLPPNVLDGFVTAKEIHLETSLAKQLSDYTLLLQQSTEKDIRIEEQSKAAELSAALTGKLGEEVNELTRRLRELEHHASELRAQIEESRAQLRVSKLDLLEAQNARQVLTSRLLETDASLRDANAHIALIYSTKSWRITAPLRWISRQRNASLFATFAPTLRRGLRWGAERARRVAFLVAWAHKIRARYPRFWITFIRPLLGNAYGHLKPPIQEQTPSSLAEVAGNIGGTSLNDIRRLLKEEVNRQTQA